MGPAKVHIYELPFEEILRSVRETLRVECAGFLFGDCLKRKSGLRWYVETAHPLQLVDRFPNSTEFDADSRGDWSLFYESIGGYHLHPTSRKQVNGVRRINPGRVYLSGADRENLRESPEKIELVIGLRRVQRAGKLGENPFLVSGYFDLDNKVHRFDLGCYYIYGRIRRAHLSVPKRVLKMLR